MQLTTSAAMTLKNLRAIVFSPPGMSKTFSSLTLSEKIPADFTHIKPKALKTREPLVELDDLLWLAADRGATDGLKQQGLSVPQIDLSGVDMQLWDKECMEVQKLLKDRVTAKRTKAVVVDTVSALDEMFVHRAKNIKGLEKFDLYGDVLNSHQRFAMPLKALDCHVLFLCHSKALIELSGTSEAVQNQKKSRTAAGLAGIVPAITGASLNHYCRDASLILTLNRVRLSPAEGGGEAHFFITNNAEFGVKSRFIVPEKIPADWRQVKAQLQLKEGAA